MAQQGLTPLWTEGIENNFGLELADQPKTWSKIFHVDSTDKRYVDHQGYSGLGAPQRRLPGEAIREDTISPSFSKRYIMDSYGLGTAVPVEDMDDDQYGMYAKWIASAGGEFARSFATLLEVTTANWFAVTAFASGTSVAGMADGLSLFNTAHPLNSSNNIGQTQSNRVNADLSIASAQQVEVMLNTQKKGNNFQIINNAPRAVVVNTTQKFIAEQVYKGSMERGTSDNNKNVVKDVDIIVWPYFTRSGTVGSATNAYNGWFVVGQEHYLYFFMRQPFKMKTDEDINTNSHLFAATIRYGFGGSDWRGTAGSGGS